MSQVLLTTSIIGRTVDAIPGWCVYESIRYHLGVRMIHTWIFYINRALRNHPWDRSNSQRLTVSTTVANLPITVLNT